MKAELDAKHQAGAGTAEPHALELTAWEIPSAIGAGDRFTVAVGARCSAGCNLGGKELILARHNGSPVGTAKLGHAVWPGTETLYFAEVEAQAPLEAGSHPWEAKMAGWDGESPHAAGSCALSVRVVAAPDCEVTIEAIDRENRAPIRGARIVMHPYRAVTGDDGIAKVKVARGEYDILVAGSRCLPYCTSVAVTADMVTRIELDAEPSINEVLE